MLRPAGLAWILVGLAIFCAGTLSAGPARAATRHSEQHQGKPQKPVTDHSRHKSTATKPMRPGKAPGGKEIAGKTKAATPAKTNGKTQAKAAPSEKTPLQARKSGRVSAPSHARTSGHARASTKIRKAHKGHLAKTARRSKAEPPAKPQRTYHRMRVHRRSATAGE